MRARLIATLMMRQQVDVIVSSLVNDGYTISPNLAGDETFTTEQGNVCGLMGIIISSDQRGEIKDCLKDIKRAMNKVKHYSYTLHALDGERRSWWTYVGNFLMPEEEDRRKREAHAEKLL